MVISRSSRLFIVLGGFFVTNALVAEFIGVKIFSLEQTLGLDPFNLSLFGSGQLSMMLSAGVLLWPVVFVTTDIMNEYFGRRGVQLLSFLCAGLILYAFLAILGAIHLVPAEFWITVNIPKGVPDMQAAFQSIFGQGMWIIAGSITAFLASQLIDVFTFHRIRRATGAGRIWMRATGSTLVSQLFDSFIVLFIAFYIGAGWELKLVLAIMTVNYIYKAMMAVALTPVIYAAHWIIDGYLGEESAERMRREAASGGSLTHNT